MSHSVRAWVLVHFVFLSAPVLSVAETLPAGKERAEIAEVLKSTVEAGYREEDVDRFISAYDNGAEIVNYVYGKIDKRTLREKTIEDFERLSDQEVSVEVLEAIPEGDGVVVLISISLQGVFDGVDRANRRDRYYLYMKKTEGKWKIFRQSYRRDFGVTEFPHLGQ